jgi:hypothetical protein
MHVLTLADGHLAPAGEDSEGAGHSDPRAGVQDAAARRARVADTRETTIAHPQAAHGPLRQTLCQQDQIIPPSDGLKPFAPGEHDARLALD